MNKIVKYGLVGGLVFLAAGLVMISWWTFRSVPMKSGVQQGDMLGEPALFLVVRGDHGGYCSPEVRKIPLKELRQVTSTLAPSHYKSWGLQTPNMALKVTTGRLEFIGDEEFYGDFKVTRICDVVDVPAVHYRGEPWMMIAYSESTQVFISRFQETGDLK